MGRNRSNLKNFASSSSRFSSWALSGVQRLAQHNRNRRPFTVEQVLGFPSPDNLIASPSGSTIAWTFNERGVRNIYVADAPGFEARKLTAYTQDDGQELTQLSFSSDGKTIVYVRGGDHGGRAGDGPPNPAGDPVQPRIQLWSVLLSGGSPRLVGDGDTPAIAPDNPRVAFTRDRRIWVAPIDGSRPAQQALLREVRASHRLGRRTVRLSRLYPIARTTASSDCSPPDALFDLLRRRHHAIRCRYGRRTGRGLRSFGNRVWAARRSRH